MRVSPNKWESGSIGDVQPHHDGAGIAPTCGMPLSKEKLGGVVRVQTVAQN
jgi:hypothetical protein